jgi:DNA-binding response OmpR family regulator
MPGSMHILLVEDEEKIRYAMVRMLEQHGHTTCWSSTGAGALRLLRSEPVELMLLDVMLPDLSGWEVRREQLADREISGVPVIVISGLSPQDVRNPMATVQLVMTKPIDVDELLRAIRAIAALNEWQKPR